MTGLRPLSRTRLHLEQLEGRALPSGFGSLIPIPGVGAVVADIKDIRADVQSLTKQIGSQASSQLATLRADVTKLVGDAASGSTSAVTADLNTLSTDANALVNSLGSTAKSHVHKILTDLQKDFKALSAEVTGLGSALGGGLSQTDTVIRDLLSVGKELQTLTGSLGASITPTVTNDIHAVGNAIGTAIGDLINGTSLTQDLTNLTSAVTTLTTAIGSGTPVQGILTSLTNEVQKLTTDITALTAPAQAALTKVESAVTSLESSLGSNLSPALQADEAALNAAITALAADVAAGKSITSDLGSALTSEFNLLRDLPSPLVAGTRQSLMQLASDLVGLAPVLNL